MHDDDIPYLLEESSVAEFSKNVADADTIEGTALRTFRAGYKVVPEKMPSDGLPPFYRATKPAHLYTDRKSKCKESIVRDIFTELAEMTKQESRIYLEVHHSMSHNNNIGTCERPTDASKNNSFSRAYAQLKRKEVLRRVRNDTYMINPLLIVPKEYEQAALTWRALK